MFQHSSFAASDLGVIWYFFILVQTMGLVMWLGLLPLHPY